MRKTLCLFFINTGIYMATFNLNSDSICITCDFADRDKVKELGGNWVAKGKQWQFAFTTDNIEKIISAFPNIYISDSVQSRIEDLVKREERLEKIRILANEDKKVSLKIKGWNKEMPPYNYQKLGIMFSIVNDNGVLLADEMGLGKTLQGIGTALYKKHHQGIKECLVITPASLKYNWPEDIKKFTNETCVVIDGTPAQREEQWFSDAFFKIVNYELVVEDFGESRPIKINIDDSPEQVVKKEKRIEAQKLRKQKLSKFKNKTHEIIICDEVHALKNPKSKRSKAVKSLKSRFRMGLTGTPIDGRLEELHSIMDWIIPSLFESKSRFLRRYGETDFFGALTGYRDIAEVRERIQPFFLRRLKKNVLKDLPDKIYVNRYVTLSNKEKKIYEQIKSGEHPSVEGEEAMVMAMRAKQFCDDPMWKSGEINVPQSKLEAFKELLQEICIDNMQKLIVFTQYSTMLHKLVEIIEEVGLKHLSIYGETDKKVRIDYCKQFNTDPAIDVIIGTEAMSTGLNMTGGDVVLNYDDNWSPAIMRQREDRAHRNGRKGNVTVINMICRGTIEERIRDVLYGKESINDEALGDGTDESVLKRMSNDDIAKLL